MMAKERECPKCKVMKPLTSEHWHKNKSTKTGFFNCCKECKLSIDKANYKRKPKKEYALYKGEDILITGTIKEIAEHQGIKENTVRFMMSNAYAKRVKDNAKILVVLD